MNVETHNFGENLTVDLNDCLQLGKLVGFWGVKGWLKVFSYTRPRINISQYQQWLLVKSSKQNNPSVSAIRVSIKNCKEQGQNIVAKFDGIDYRDQAELLLGYEVYIEKTQLKPLQPGEFYWSEMLNCDVTNLQGVLLGKVESIMETGANDVLLVRQSQCDKVQNSSAVIEHLIPYSEEIVLSVDVENKVISVDWGEDFLAQEVINKPQKKQKLTKQDRAEKIRLQKLEQQSMDKSLD